MKIRQAIRFVAVPALALSAALCVAQQAGDSIDGGQDRIFWAPPTIEPGAYDDITAYNIFSPERSALAAEAQRVPEPDEPEDTGPPEPVIELPPPDPDATLVLVGISVRGATPTAFIEDVANGLVLVIESPGPFSEGEVQSITPTGITYIVEGDTRQVHVGQTLTGEAPPQAAPSRGGSASPRTGSGTTSDTSSEDGSATPPGDDGMTELERRMRERRNRE